MLDETLEYVVRPETIQDLVDQEAENLYIGFCTKNIEWSGEQEWRFSVTSDQVTSNLVDFDFAETIYLGENISEYWKRRLIKIVKEQQLKVFQRKLDKFKSMWQYEEIRL